MLPEAVKEMAKILLVEDDRDLSGRVNEWLSFEQHAIESVFDGMAASQRLRVYFYEVVVLDWDLPRLSGLEVCKGYRSHGGTAPILMLTGKDAISFKEAGLDAGADDYLTKPFHLKELSARIRALLRRPVPSYTGNTLKIGGLELDPSTRRVTRNGEDLTLLPKEYGLLEFFMRHPNEVFSPDALLNRVWHSESDAAADTIYTYIKMLRKKITPEAPTSLIKTVHGVGYKMESK